MRSVILTKYIVLMYMVVTIYYNFSPKMISLKQIKNGCVVLRT